MKFHQKNQDFSVRSATVPHLATRTRGASAYEQREEKLFLALAAEGRELTTKDSVFERASEGERGNGPAEEVMSMPSICGFLILHSRCAATHTGCSGLFRARIVCE